MAVLDSTKAVINADRNSLYIATGSTNNQTYDCTGYSDVYFVWTMYTNIQPPMITFNVDSYTTLHLRNLSMSKSIPIQFSGAINVLGNIPIPVAGCALEKTMVIGKNSVSINSQYLETNYPSPLFTSDVDDLNAAGATIVAPQARYCYINSTHDGDKTLYGYPGQIISYYNAAGNDRYLNVRFRSNYSTNNNLLLKTIIAAQSRALIKFGVDSAVWLYAN